MHPFRTSKLTATLLLLIGFLLHAILFPETAQWTQYARYGNLRDSLEIAMMALPQTIRVGSLYKYGRGLSSYYNYTAFQHRVSPAFSSLNSLRFGSTNATNTNTNTNTDTMASKVSFIDAVKGRRSIYALNKKAPISDAAIEQLVKDTVLSVPSFFNTQTARLVVLLKDEHDKFWDLTGEILKPIVPEDQWAGTEGKLGAFKAGYGTILFYEEPEARLALEKAYPIYAHHMPSWSEHTSAMHQFVLWAGLEAEGFGANLQHYHPIIDAKVAEQWKVPADWSLKAQLVFGGKAGEANEKTFKPIEERVFIHGK